MFMMIIRMVIINIHLKSIMAIMEEEKDKLVVQLKDDKYTLAESERKYEDIARKLATKEDENTRSNERL